MVGVAASQGEASIDPILSAETIELLDDIVIELAELEERVGDVRLARLVDELTEDPGLGVDAEAAVHLARALERGGVLREIENASVAFPWVYYHPPMTYRGRV